MDLEDSPSLHDQNPVHNADVQSLLLDWIHSDSRARLIFDSKRRIVWRNDTASVLLKNELPIREISGVLTATDADIECSLDRFLSAVPASGALLCLSKGKGKRHAVLHVASSTAIGSEWLVAAELYAPLLDEPPLYAGYEKVFDLTPAEQRIVRHMSEGATAEQIAASCGSSIGTVRTHIRNIYTKMSVKSREGMYSILAHFRIF